MSLLAVKLQSETTKKEVNIRVTTDERRRAIAKVLCARKHETRENLAFEFDVSIRTITRDITALSFEYPISTVVGPGGGICIDDGFESRQYSKLSCKEQAVLEKLKGFLTGEDKKAIESILLHFGRKQGGQT